MDSARYETILPYLRLENIEIHQLDVNRSDFKTLVNHPYLSYDLVKAIFKQRDSKGMIKNWSQLQMVTKNVGELNPMLENYIKF